MATLTIEIPDSLHQHMNQVDADWSEICRQAITAKLTNEIKVDKSTSPQWIDSRDLSQDTVFKPLASNDECLFHPHQVVKKLNDILRDATVVLADKKQSGYYFIDQNIGTKIIEPNSSWRPCIYTARASLHFIRLDEINFYKGIWKVEIYTPKGQYRCHAKFRDIKSPAIVEVADTYQEDHDSLQIISVEFLADRVQFSLDIPNVGDSGVFYALYKDMSVSSFDGYLTNSGGPPMWSAIRL